MQTVEKEKEVCNHHAPNTHKPCKVEREYSNLRLWCSAINNKEYKNFSRYPAKCWPCVVEMIKSEI